MLSHAGEVVLYSFSHHKFICNLDWLDSEMHLHNGKHETLDVLHQVIEHPESLRILAVFDIQQASNLSGCERDVLRTKHDLIK